MDKVELPNGVVAYECKALPSWNVKPGEPVYSYWSYESQGNPLSPQEIKGLELDDQGKILGVIYLGDYFL